MIENIIIKNAASFDTTAVSFDPQKINMIYGANGSGKTTLSNIIANCSTYQDCSIVWKDGITDSIQVYNRNFIRDNFEQSPNIDGIYTLGKENKDEQEKIISFKNDIDKKTQLLANYTNEIQKFVDSIEQEEAAFSDKCWSHRGEYGPIFIKAFEGYRNSKQKHYLEVKRLFAEGAHTEIAFPELERSAKTIFDSTRTKVPEISAFIPPQLHDIEQHGIFQIKIIGKMDVDISAMINYLDNSDWVRQGIRFLDKNNNFCPFCQQAIPSNFREQLSEYFDDQYNKNLTILKTTINEYNRRTSSLILQLVFSA